MFIELTEYLRCPADHDSTFLVLAPDLVRDRDVVSGVVGCPVCHAEYPIVDGIVRFGVAPPPGPALHPPADVVQAVLGLESPGGLIALVGTLGALAADLHAACAVHCVAVNSPDARSSSHTSVLWCATGVPLRDHVVRGVVLDAASASPDLLAEAERVVLRGQRVVALSESVSAPSGLEPLATGQGMWVGRKT